MDAKPTGYQNFKDWKEWISSSIGILPDAGVKKDFKGVLKFDNTKASKSNSEKITDAKVFWDSLWNIDNISGIYNVEMSSYFKVKNPLNLTLIGSPTFDYSKITQKYMSSILNFNGTIFSHLLQMPYDSEQWIPFSFSNIPIVGKYLNQLNLGIPFGFILGQDSKQYQKMPFFNGFMSAFFTNALTDVFGKNGLIPLNLFSNNKENEIGRLLGANISTTTFLMKLTDRISIYPWNLEGKKLTTPEQISTVDLSQIRNDKVYVMAEDTGFLDIASPLTNEDTKIQWNPTPDGVAPGANYAYIIDYIVTQSLHQGEERHTFYSNNPIANNINDFNELSVAQYRFNNSAFFTGNMFNWTTQYKTNHDEYEETEETTFSYPAKILPPDPQNIAKPLIIIPKNPTVDITLQNWETLKHNNKEMYNDNTDWINNNLPLIKPLEIDINFKDYLDPTLLINNFNDFKRYYKSIDVYLSCKYETEEWPEIIYSLITTDEKFIPTNEFSWQFSKEFNILNIYNTNKNLKLFEEHNIQYYDGSYYLDWYVGVSKIGTLPDDINNLYEISKNNLSSIVYYDNKNINISSDNSTYLGFYDNSDKDFKWKIQLFPIINQVQGADFQIDSSGYSWIKK